MNQEYGLTRRTYPDIRLQQTRARLGFSLSYEKHRVIGKEISLRKRSAKRWLRQRAELLA